MKIALAQIDMRPGDIEGICARLESQAVLAHAQDARLLLAPVSLLCGLAPGGLVDDADFEHDLLTALTALSGRLDALGMIGLIPGVVGFEGVPLFEAFMLKDGRVIPVRTLLARRRMASFDEPWLPPIFDIDGVRIAITFDVRRDLETLPPGCDLVIYFQAASFSVDDEFSTAVAAVADGHFSTEIARKGVWMACMAPIGGYDEAAYTGGSFVMDDCGRVVAAAPCFEEALVVQDVRRGMMQPALEAHELPRYQREEWLWEALRLHLRDTIAARGASGAALLLEGDLPSSLTAALAVDALGPRNVTGVLVGRTGACTPAEEEAERVRMERARALAAGLGIRVVERAPIDGALLADRDEPAPARPRAQAWLEGLCLEDVAEELGACPISSLTKTDAALAPAARAGSALGVVAPFGDVYLTSLEFVARARSRAGSALPASLITLNAVEERMRAIVAAAVGSCRALEGYREHAIRLIAALEPSQIDGILEGHVDRGLAFADIPAARSHTEAAALVLLLVRAGESARRQLPSVPMVSARSFAERAWPPALAWFVSGERAGEPLTCDALAASEAERFAARGEEHGERVRHEIMGVISSILGVPVDQLDGSGFEEELMRRWQRDHGSGAGPADNPPAGGPRQQGFTFFSPN